MLIDNRVAGRAEIILNPEEKDFYSPAVAYLLMKPPTRIWEKFLIQFWNGENKWKFFACLKRL